MAGWDCHAHVIGDPEAFPLWSGRSYTPAPASLESYLAMLDRHGLAHGVLVQPSAYGYDNRCLLDALDRAGGRLFGIVVPPPKTPPRDLEAMHGRGVRGVRCNPINPGGLSVNDLAPWRDVMRELGWHVEVHAHIDDLGDLAAFLDRVGLPVVFDHLGRPRDFDPASPAPRQLIDLVRGSACFVKTSAPYRVSLTGPPWRDVEPLIQALVAANARQCLWGTDWPHVHIASPVRTADLIAARAGWFPHSAVQLQVIAENPRRLFETAASPRRR